MSSERVADAVAAGSGLGGVLLFGRWAINWFTNRVDKRQAQLDAEHDALDMSWKDYRLHLERRMSAMETQNVALRLSFQHATAALMRHDPADPALAIIERIMAQAFPMDFGVVTSLAEAGLDRGMQR